MHKKFILNILQTLLFFSLALFLGACASQKAGMKSPELPARHWLESVPGVPVENKSKLESAIKNLYDPAKKFSFEECVYLAIQQSPMLVNSAVNLEIKRLALTDSVWRYLPEPKMTLSVTNNITRYNEDTKYVSGDYGRTKFDVGFKCDFPNPVGTYFEHQVRRGLANMAISTHRKAVGEAIYDIAKIYLRLQSLREIIEAKKAVLPLGKEMKNYWQQVEVVEGRQGVQVNLADQHQKELELTVEKSQMELTMEKTKLKILLGVDAHQKLEVDEASANYILTGFNGHNLHWQDRWSATEDDLLLRGQVKLADYNIMVAWAQYMPQMSLEVNKQPPSGQAQPSGGEEDLFLHLNFEFPLIDWGRRYRGVQTARMEKAQAFHEMARKRTEYANRWLQAEQAVALAENKLKIAKTQLTTSELQYKEAQIAFREGIEEMPVVTNLHEQMANAKIRYIESELEYKLAHLQWMYLANLLQQRFLGLPLKNLME
ncbi:MAG: TolC family protein [Desulfovibrionaceae bacterium]|nr:TolC family protein [Desulfovibrionaceae bacterium]